MLCRRGGGGGGRAWGGDLIVFVGPGVGHLTDLVLPGEGIFESLFARRGEKRGRKPHREDPYITTSWFAIALDEIKN